MPQTRKRLQELFDLTTPEQKIEMCRELNVSRATLYNWIAEPLNLSAAKLLKIGQLFQIDSIDELIAPAQNIVHINSK